MLDRLEAALLFAAFTLLGFFISPTEMLESE